MTHLLKRLSLVFICLVIINSCKKDDPKGDIQYDVKNIFSTSFNYTAKANAYKWDFGDNNFSTEISPVHRYKHGGLYHVKLQADNQLIQKDVKILSPDTARITSMIIQGMEFDPSYADANPLYNVYWILQDADTGKKDTGIVKNGVTAADLPFIWNNIDIAIPLNDNHQYYLWNGFYKSSTHTYETQSGYSFGLDYILGLQGHQDTLHIWKNNNDDHFACVTKWIISQ